MARGFAIASLTILPLVGLAGQGGQRAGLLGSGFAASIVTAISVACLLVAGVLIADRFDRLTSEVHATAATLGAILDASPLGIITFDTDSRVLYWSRGAELTYGWSASEVVGHPAPHFPGDAGSTVMEDQWRRIRAGETHLSEETTRVSKTGADIEVALSVVPLLDNAGRSIGLLATHEDIRGRKRTEANLRRSNEELEQFAYVVSHDLRAPLRAIRNLVGWIAEDMGGESALPPAVVKNIDLLHERTDRLDALIEGILQYSRIGRETHAVAEIDPARLIEGTWSLLGPPASVELELRSDVPTIRVAETPLSLVLRNLLDNAVKHNDQPRGLISVTVSEDKRAYRFDVADNGPGIPPEHRERIFRIFETLQPKDTTGTVGVGLALVRKTISQVGGSIEVLDNPAGRGTLFRVKWPKAAAAG